MKIGVLLTPMSELNLKRASQVGATDIVATYPGLDRETLLGKQREAQKYGMKISCIERLIPTLKFVHNLPGANEQIEGFKTLIRNMDAADIRTLSYSWMPDDDWQRTTIEAMERGGASTTAFNLEDFDAAKVPTDTGFALPEGHQGTTADALWENLQTFLEEVIPVAEKCGVKLALHPDDPPIDHLNGQDRIITTPEAMQRVVELVPSDVNGLCFCQGTFASRGGIDIPSAIEKLAPHITMAHFRDVTGELPSFKESFIDNGKTDMVACMEAYLNCPNDFVIRPDHVPTLAGEGADNPGYKTLGRLHAIGYMQGLVHALER